MKKFTLAVVLICATAISYGQLPTGPVRTLAQHIQQDSMYHLDTSDYPTIKFKSDTSGGRRIYTMSEEQRMWNELLIQCPPCLNTAVKYKIWIWQTMPIIIRNEIKKAKPL